MTGNEFLDRLKRLAIRENKAFGFDSRGKGSHGRILFGDRFTTVPDPRKELKKGTLSSMCRNLGIKPQDLY
ncbi:MAG: type II toxin-antitoxin system HicA family toxin [Rhodoplanes sp.]